MLVSVATANFYFIPFEEALDIIAEAGFRNIELDLYWGRNQWSMARHLKDIPIPKALQAIQQVGLNVTSIHDGGGVLPDYQSLSTYINPRLDETIQQLGYAPVHIVFHPPQVGGNPGGDWWELISGDISQALEPYRQVCKHLTLENIPAYDGLAVPLIPPEALREFTAQHGLGVTVDTTHYAQIDVDILAAVRVLRDSMRSIHFSDYRQGQTHVLPGEGDLDLPGFLRLVDFSRLDAITLECSVSTSDKSDRQMSHAEMVARMKIAKTNVERMLEER